MAKIGKSKTEPYDAFQSGKQALSETLGELESPPRRESAPVVERREPVSVPERRDPPRNEQRAAATQRSEEQGGSASRFSKRFQCSREEGADYDAAAMRLSGAVGAKIDFSKVTRALWAVYMRHEQDILRSVRDDDYFFPRSNQDSVGLAQLEEEVSKLLNRGLMVGSRRRRSLEE